MNAIQDLPLGWAIAPVGDVCSQPQYGYTTRASNEGDLRLLRTSDITSGKINWETVPYCSENPDDMEKYILKDGDILVSRAGSIGVSHLVTNPQEAVFASYLIRFKPLIDAQFLAYFLQSPKYWVTIADEKLGIAVPNVNATKLRSIMVPVPPVREQRRIVAKIDELFSELDKGVESLKQARRQLAVYRQSVLKHAFEGKLTAHWRAENKDKLETPEQSLARIKRDQKARYEEQFREWKAAVEAWNADGRLGRKPPRPKKLPHPLPVRVGDVLALEKLPDGWSWSTFSTIATSIQIGPFGSLLHKQDYLVGGTPLVNPSHVRCQRIEPDRALTVSPDKLNQLRKYVMQENDIVIGRRGEMGRCAVVTVVEAGWLCGTGSLFVRLLPSMNPYFYSWFMSSQRVKDFLAASSIGTTMQNLNEGILHRVPVPVCSRHEQDEALKEIERQYSTLDQIEAGINSWIAKSITLRQSILKNAFSGELVPQDPDDEPASVILDRIKAERKQRAESRMVRRRTRKQRATA